MIVDYWIVFASGALCGFCWGVFGTLVYLQRRFAR